MRLATERGRSNRRRRLTSSECRKPGATSRRGGDRPLHAPGWPGVVRLAVDTGGTFTDLVVEGDDGVRRLYKSSTTPEDPIDGVLNVITLAARDLGRSRTELLGGSRAVDLRDDASDQRRDHRNSRTDRIPHHRGPPRDPGLPRRGPNRALQPPSDLSPSLHTTPAYLGSP
jgi:hypothetical protein